MPLIKRRIEPVLVSRSDHLEVIPKGVPELECLTNVTLASVIRQMSNLARHAEDLFSELFNEANNVYKKSCAIQQRVDVLSAQVTKLDAINDKESLEGFMNQTPYQNTFVTDQIMLGNETLPVALQEARAKCDPVPPLGNLDQYREDGKEALKFYTNPGYFFELWCEDMQKNISEDAKKKHRKKRHKRNRKNSNKPTKLKTKKDQYQIMAKGAEFIETPKSDYSNTIQSKEVTPDNRKSAAPAFYDMSQSPSTKRRQSNDRRQSNQPEDRRRSEGVVNHHEYDTPPPASTDHKRHSQPHTRPGRKAPAPPGPPSPNSQPTYENRMSHHPQEDPRMSQYGNLQPVPEGALAPPPPPPPPVPGGAGIPAPPPPPDQNFNPAGQTHEYDMPPPPPMNGYGMSPPNSSIPAPPPPPPPGGMLQQNGNIPAPPPPPPPGGIGPPSGLTQTPTLTPAASEPNKRISQLPVPRQADGRSDLLKAIQDGMSLRKVQVNEKKERKQSKPANSVEAILQRRLEALQVSDSDSEGEYSSDDSWSDDD